MSSCAFLKLKLYFLVKIYLGTWDFALCGNFLLKSVHDYPGFFMNCDYLGIVLNVLDSQPGFSP